MYTNLAISNFRHNTTQRAVVDRYWTPHIFQLQPQIHSRLNWLDASLLYLCKISVISAWFHPPRRIVLVTPLARITKNRYNLPVYRATKSKKTTMTSNFKLALQYIAKSAENLLWRPHSKFSRASAVRGRDVRNRFLKFRFGLSSIFWEKNTRIQFGMRLVRYGSKNTVRFG